jgi:hypothetical protein
MLPQLSLKFRSQRARLGRVWREMQKLHVQEKVVLTRAHSRADLLDVQRLDFRRYLAREPRILR